MMNGDWGSAVVDRRYRRGKFHSRIEHEQDKEQEQEDGMSNAERRTPNQSTSVAQKSEQEQKFTRCEKAIFREVVLRREYGST